MTTDEARQLADTLDAESERNPWPYQITAANVLREQADEIDRLRATIAALLAVPARTNPYRFSGYASKARAWQEGYDAAVAALRVPANGPGADRG